MFTPACWVILGALGAQQERPVDLVLQITVDQLRGDAVTRFGDRFVEGGFKLLIEGGTHYTNAHYPHANTETAPGHASLATGANPTRHGIVANDWIDQTTGEFVYNTEDERHHILGADPRPHQGVSPRNLLSSTIGDEIVNHHAERSRSFSVSSKDRGAILPGGHRGKAFWYSNRDGRFVTSSYYYDDPPAWLDTWNAKRPADEYKGREWGLVTESESYLARADDRPFEVAFDALGRTFPHPLGDGSSKLFYVVLYVSPMADELTLDVAKSLLEAEQLGQRGELDYLQVSFSAPDICGHLFGQASLEYEDAVLRTDRLLADLFSRVDSSVGLDRTLVVLSADHGGTESPEYLAASGRDVGRFPLDLFRRNNPLASALQLRFGRDDLIAGHSHPYLYLNLDAISEEGLDQAEVERFVAREAMKLPGIAYAMTRSELLDGQYVDAPLQRQIRNSFHASRSGHVYLVQEQGWLLHSTEEAEKLGLEDDLAAIHGSPWVYDTFVPILIAGPGVPYQRVHRRVSPYDVAPTIAAYLGVKPPSGSIGDPLFEALSK